MKPETNGHPRVRVNGHEFNRDKRLGNEYSLSRTVEKMRPLLEESQAEVAVLRRTLAVTWAKKNGHSDLSFGQQYDLWIQNLPPNSPLRPLPEGQEWH
jgi:hypothetical protein